VDWKGANRGTRGSNCREAQPVEAKKPTKCWKRNYQGKSWDRVTFRKHWLEHILTDARNW